MPRSTVLDTRRRSEGAMVGMWLWMACGGTPETGPPPEGEPVEAEAPATVVVYSGRSESLMKPILDRIAEQTGLTLEVQYGKTPELVTRLATEGAQSPADLVLAQEAGHLAVLARRDLLAPLPSGVLDAVDPRFRDPDGRWVGTSGRLRVLVHDTEAMPVSAMPATLKDLADPKYKGKLGWAPTNGSFQSHLGALCSLWGEEDTAAWLDAMKANAPRAYPKNSPQVDAADASEIGIGWVNHYYLHRKDRSKAANYSFPTDGDAGNILMVAGASIVAGSDASDEAVQVLEALVAADAQTYFATEVFEYPTRPGIATHADVPPLSGLKLANVDPTALSELGCARKLLDDAGLL